MLLKQMPSYNEYSDKVDELLQSFKYAKLNKLLDLIKSLIERIWKLIEKIPLFKGSKQAQGHSQVVQMVIYIVLLMLFIFVISLIVVRIKRKKRRAKTILGETIDKNSTVGQFLDKSQFYEQQGHYRDATRLKFVAVLFYLHQNHYLYHDQSMTGKEMVEKLSKINFIGVKPFEGMTQMFNTIWYGMKEIDQVEYEKWCAYEKAFWQGVKP